MLVLIPGAHFLEELSRKFDSMMQSPQPVEDKTLDNLVACLALLYSFKVRYARTQAYDRIPFHILVASYIISFCLTSMYEQLYVKTCNLHNYITVMQLSSSNFIITKQKFLLSLDESAWLAKHPSKSKMVDLLFFVHNKS